MPQHENGDIYVAKEYFCGDAANAVPENDDWRHGAAMPVFRQTGTIKPLIAKQLAATQRCVLMSRKQL